MTAWHIQACGPLETNAVFLWDASDPRRRTLLVDPGDDLPALQRVIEEEQLTLEAILLTHGHLDHCGALDGCRSLWPVPTYMHPEDRFLLGAAVNLELARMMNISIPQPPQNPLQEGQVLTVGGLTPTVLHTPGHSPGSICLLLPDLLISGDTLFAGGMGRTDLPGGSEARMHQSLGRLSRLSPSLTVIPGHGPTSSLQEELTRNPFLRRP